MIGGVASIDVGTGARAPFSSLFIMALGYSLKHFRGKSETFRGFPDVSLFGTRSVPGPESEMGMTEYRNPDDDGLDLRLISWGDGSEVPAEARNLMIVGIGFDGLLHIRIFDAGGHQVTDTDETRHPGMRAGSTAALKQFLPGLLPPHVPSLGEKAQVIEQVNAIVKDLPDRIPGALEKALGRPEIASELFFPIALRLVAGAETAVLRQAGGPRARSIDGRGRPVPVQRSDRARCRRRDGLSE